MSFRVINRPTKKSRDRGDLAARLHRWRKKNNLSQAEAALELQVSFRTLQEWEQGRSRPRGLAAASLQQLLKS